jgi:hypothetical protein
VTTVLASVLILLSGVVNILWGIGAVLNDDFFAFNDGKLLYVNLTGAGIVVLVIGIAKVVVAAAVYNQNRLAGWIVLVLASLNVVFSLLSIQLTPWWAIVSVAINLIVIYGVARFLGHHPDNQARQPAR